MSAADKPAERFVQGVHLVIGSGAAPVDVYAEPITATVLTTTSVIVWTLFALDGDQTPVYRLRAIQRPAGDMSRLAVGDTERHVATLALDNSHPYPGAPPTVVHVFAERTD